MQLRIRQCPAVHQVIFAMLLHSFDDSRFVSWDDNWRHDNFVTVHDSLQSSSLIICTQFYCIYIVTTLLQRRLRQLNLILKRHDLCWNRKKVSIVTIQQQFAFKNANENKHLLRKKLFSLRCKFLSKNFPTPNLHQRLMDFIQTTTKQRH